MKRIVSLPTGMSATFLANFLTSGLASLGLLVVALILTPAEIADVRVFQAIIVIGMTVAGLGYTTGLLKACAEAATVELRASYLNKVSRQTLFSSLVYASLLVGGGALGVSGIDRTEIGSVLPLMVICVPLAVVVENFRNALYAERRFGDAARVQIGVRIISFAAIVLATYWLGFSGFVIGTVASYAAGALWFVREIGVSFYRANPVAFPNYFVRFSLFAMLGNLFVILASYGDMILLYSMNDDRDVLGAYALAAACLGGLMVVTTSFQTVLLPDMIDLRKGRDWMRATFLSQQIRLAALSLVAAVLASLAVAVLFPAIYGNSYRLVPPLFAGLCVSYVLISFGTLAGSVLMGLGRTSTNTLVAGVAILVGYGVALWSIQMNGVWGMVAGKIAYGLVICLLGNFLVWRNLKTTDMKE